MIDYANATFEQRVMICEASKALHLGLPLTGLDAMLSKITGRDMMSPFTRDETIAATLLPDVFGSKGLTLKVVYTNTSAGNWICEIEYADGETMMVVESTTRALALVSALAYAMHDGLTGALVDFVG